MDIPYYSVLKVGRMYACTCHYVWGMSGTHWKWTASLATSPFLLTPTPIDGAMDRSRRCIRRPGGQRRNLSSDCYPWAESFSRSVSSAQPRRLGLLKGTHSLSHSLTHTFCLPTCRRTPEPCTFSIAPLESGKASQPIKPPFFRFWCSRSPLPLAALLPKGQAFACTSTAAASHHLSVCSLPCPPVNTTSIPYLLLLRT